MDAYLLSFSDPDRLAERYQTLAAHLVATPILTSNALDKAAGCELFFKAENLQRSGAFKMRGVSNALLELQSSDRHIPGVCTHSSGNHGHALGWASADAELPCIVVMPENAPQIKKDAVANTGAEIILCPSNLADRITTLNQVKATHGFVEIHPSNQPEVILGQGSAAWELLHELKAQGQTLDVIIVPTGGGGLLAGTGFAVQVWNAQHGTDIQVIGAEPEGADDAARSLASGQIQHNEQPQTIADGLRTELGDVNFPVIQETVRAIYNVSDEEILLHHEAICKRLETLIEYNSSPPLAVVHRHPDLFLGQRVGIVLSGGNFLS